MDMDQLKQILAAQQQQHQEAMAQQQQATMTQMMAFFQQQQQNRGGGDNVQPAPNAFPSISTLPQLPDMEVFSSDDSDPNKFQNWMKRFKFSLDCTAPNMVESSKVKLLMTKLSAEAFSEYCKSCLPQDVTDFSLDETVSSLSKLFSRSRSLVVDRFECLRLTKDDEEDFRHFVNRLKDQLRLFKFSELKEEEFSCLLLLLGLKSPRDAALRTRLLQRINDGGTEVKFNQVVEEAAGYLSTIAEAKQLERSANALAINAISTKKEYGKKNFKKPAAKNRSPPYHPQSNGQAERFVDTFKRSLLKCKGKGTEDAIEEFLISYRTTPSAAAPHGKSPAEAFLGRKPITKLGLLLPSSTALPSRDFQMEDQFNRRNGTKKRCFENGDAVFCRRNVDDQWVAGTVLFSAQGVVYNVKLATGKVSRFHINQLRVRSTSSDVADDWLEVMLDTFCLPSKPKPVAPQPVDQMLAEVDLAPAAMDSVGGSPAVDRPLRNRIPPKRIQMSWTKKHYY